MGVIIYFAVGEVRKQDKELAVKDTVIALNKQAREFKLELEEAIKAGQILSQEETEALETKLQEANDDLARRSRDAEFNATNTPIAFGDEFIADIIRLDCMWALGQGESDPSLRSACVREAAMADPATSGIPVTVITPVFRESWVNACEDYREIGRTSSEDEGELDLVYTMDQWTETYGNFDFRLCTQTVVAFTPAFSYYFRRFLQNGEAYTSKLINFAKANRRLLDRVTEKRVLVND